MRMGRLVVAVVAATSACGAAHAPDAESVRPIQIRPIQIHSHMTFVPTDARPDGTLSSAEAFHAFAPHGKMAPGLVATLGSLTVTPAADIAGTTSYSLDGRLVWGFSLPHTCPPSGLGVGQDPGATASPTSPPTTCSSTEWNFANARTGHFILATWQMR
jgi:hypothetical protein